MEGNVEAVPHIDLLRQIQPLVLDGLDYSKAITPSLNPKSLTFLRLLPPLTPPPSLQSLLMQLMALVEDKVQNIRSPATPTPLPPAPPSTQVPSRSGGNSAQGYERVPTAAGSA